MVNKTGYAWAAGFFDGEGCVSLHTQKGYTVLRIVLVQKDIRPLEHFRTIFDRDEKINLVYRRDRRNVYFRLVISGQRAADVLTCMLPYLVLKHEVAEVALQLQDSVNLHRLAYGCIGIPKSEKAHRQTLVERAKWLNTGRWAAAETKPSGSQIERCDSPTRRDSKPVEAAEMPARPDIKV